MTPDFGLCEPGDLISVECVVRELTTESSLASRDIMLIGARCRDLLHRALGHGEELRATTDLDIGIAVKNWDLHSQVLDELPTVGNSGLRYLVADLPVDIVPFGAVENPPGVSVPPRRNSPVNVLGMQQAFDHALDLPLPDDTRIRIPTPAGFVALKMYAWADRATDYEDRDAYDLALACGWYKSSVDVENRLYGAEMTALEQADFDAGRASVRLLADDVASVLGDDLASSLRATWLARDHELLATQMSRSSAPLSTRVAATCREVVAQLGRLGLE